MTMWVLVRGGLGNQMFQLAFATALAARFGQTPRYVDLSSHARVARQWSLGCFGVEPTKVGVLTRAWLAASAVLNRKLRSPVLARRTGALIELDEFTGPPPLTRAPTLISGYWQGPAYFAGYEREVRAALRFPDVPPRWQIVPRTAGAPRVAIHVRRGDYVSDPIAAQHHLVCDPAWYRRAWAGLRESIPGAQAWVFSDDPEWVRSALALDGDVQLVALDATRPAWCDLAEMSRCDHFVISNSSFSWWAAYLGQRNGTKVVAPAHWFRGRRTADLRICPPEWQLL